MLFNVTEYEGPLDDRNFRKWESTLRKERHRRGLPSPTLTITPKGAHADSEISTAAKNRSDAQYALKLILLGDLLASGEQVTMENHHVIPLDTSEPWPEDHLLRAYPSWSRVSGGLTTAALVGARLSQRKRWQSAAWKYFYARKQCPIDWRDTHPHYSDYRPVASNPEEFVLYANSIVAAYSVIEDLGLGVRATQENPSVLPDGRKNPKILRDLEVRLRGAGVDPEWEVVWQVRSRITRLSKKRKVAGRRAEWAWRNVRDKMLATTEALYHASFLRSKAGAHSTNSLTRSLSIYDVHNVQQLARCVLMQTIGCG